MQVNSLNHKGLNSLCCHKALEFGAKHLWNVEFVFMMSLSAEMPLPVHVDLNGSHWTVTSAPSNEWPPRVSVGCLNVNHCINVRKV